MLLAGCAGPPNWNEQDLSVALGPGQARAGMVSDTKELIGGMAAEGRVGDFKIYNDRVAFIIQGRRIGDYYVQEGGGLVDADIVRPEGVPGRDVLDDMTTMLGVGRMVVPDDIEVIAFGQFGSPVAIRVHGTDTGLGLIEGTAEVPGLIAEFGVDVVTDYVLPPDSWTMEVRTTVTATDQTARYRPGDVIFTGPEAADSWAEGAGMGLPQAGNTRRFTGYIGHRNEIALGVIAAEGAAHDSSGADILTELAEVGLAFGEEVILEPGESHTWTRHYGVAPDMATLSDAALQLAGEEVDEVSGTVTAPDGPVAGARVVVSVDGAPFTAAVTDDQGAFQVDVPAGAQVETLAVGRSTGRVLDLPPGASFVGPYIYGPAQELGLKALREGAPPIPWAEGRGVADPSDPLVLGTPAWLRVTSADGLPFEARLRFLEPDPVPEDEARYHDRPSGNLLAGWSRDADLSLPAEPGTYELLVQRGLRWDLHTEEVTLAAGQTTEVTVDLGDPIDHAGWLFGDPHSHAAPSGDGEITMEGRLLVSAGNGIQLHFGTDHDRVADYRPAVEALGLPLRSVVANEVSPVLRGHLNIYPLQPLVTVPNNGALPWWSMFFETTEAQVDALRERHGPDIIVQSNHPLDSGLFAAADWEPGVIGKPDFWSDDIQAIEVNNSGSLDGLGPYFDMVARGYRVAANGVSDSHSHFGGGVGRNGTWFPLGDDPKAATDEALTEAIRNERTISARGVFLSVSEMPGSTLTGAVSIDVEARSPSWAAVDRLLLLRDGVEVDRIDGTSGTFDLQHTADCVYNISAEGDQPMSPLDGNRPWAMTGAYRYDAGGDGWTAPLGALQLAP